MRNQWKTRDQLRKKRHQKQGDVSSEYRTEQNKQWKSDLELLEKQFTRRAKRLEKKRSR